jgi:hypothetical protein
MQPVKFNDVCVRVGFLFTGKLVGMFRSFFVQHSTDVPHVGFHLFSRLDYSLRKSRLLSELSYMNLVCWSPYYLIDLHAIHGL